MRKMRVRLLKSAIVFMIVLLEGLERNSLCNASDDLYKMNTIKGSRALVAYAITIASFTEIFLLKSYFKLPKRHYLF